MSLYPEIELMTEGELLGAFFRSLPPWYYDEEQLWFDEIAHRLAYYGENCYLGIESNVDLVRKRALASGFSSLSIPVSENTESKLSEYIISQDEVIKIRAINSAGILRLPRFKDELIAQERHSASDIRAAVLRYLVRVSPEQTEPYIISYLASGDSTLIEEAIDASDELMLKKFLPIIGGFVSNENRAIRQAASTTVENLKRISA